MRPQEKIGLVVVGLGVLAVIDLVVIIFAPLVGWTLLGLLGAYTIHSFTKVNNEDLAAKFIFGEPLGDVKPGLHFTPKWIVEIRKGSTNLYEDELPGEPEQIFRKDDVLPVPEGMFPPTRVTFGGPREDDDADLKSDPYNVQMVAEVPIVVSWRIKNATAFFYNYGGVKNFRKILQDQAIKTFNDEFANVTPARARRTLPETDARMKARMQRKTARTGVEIDDAFVKPFIYSHDWNTAVLGVPKARLEAKAAVRRAKGEKKVLILTGEGRAAARESLGKAEAKVAAAKAKIAGTPEGQRALAIEAMSVGLGNPGATIIFGGNDAFSGLAAQLGAAFGAGTKGVKK